MDLEFYPLMQIRLRHDYFTDGNCPEVEVVPSPATAQLMQAMMIRGVQRDYGVELFYSERSGRPTPLAEVSESLRLSFWLRTTNSLFHNYTAHLPAGGAPALFYATNHNKEAAEDIKFSLGLSERVSLEFFRFQRNISNGKDTVHITDGKKIVHITDENKNALEGEGDPVTVTTNDEGTKVAVGLVSLQAGRYFCKDGDVKTAFVAANDGYKNGDVGLLSVYLGDTGNGQRAVIAADGTIEPISLTLAFSARSTIWRYNLIADNAKFRYFSITHEGKTPEFRVPEQATRALPNGTKATVLVSAIPIQLRANPIERLRLSFIDENGRIHNDNDAILLPNAGAESLSRDGPGSTVLYSDMYVYL